MPEDIAGAVFATGYWVGKEIRWPHTGVGIDSSRLRGGLWGGLYYEGAKNRQVSG